MALYVGNQKVCPTIKVGTEPTGTINITQNGTHDVTNYASANVNVPSGQQYIARQVVVGKMERPTGAYVLPSDVTDLGDYAMYYSFYGSGLTSADFSSLTTISGRYAMDYAFYNCQSLTSVNLSSLTTISGNKAMTYCFDNCRLLTTLSFPALNSNSFGSYTNQFYKMLENVTGCTVHFPSNLQSVIGSWSDVVGGFGGTNTTVLFDLPATN